MFSGPRPETMAPAEHPPEWPDKVVYASLLLVIGGATGVVFYALLLFDIIAIGGAIPAFIASWPPWLGIPASLATAAFGVMAYRRQASTWVFGGAATGILSMSAIGLTPILSVFALIFLRLAYQEGEEMVDDERIVAADQLPDKAIIASLFMVAGGLAAWMQGIWILTGGYTAPILSSSPALWGIFSLVAGGLLFYGAKSSFNQQRLAICVTACLAACLSLGLYIIGPVMGILGLVFLWQAVSEKEFEDDAPVVA